MHKVLWNKIGGPSLSKLTTTDRQSATKCQSAIIQINLVYNIKYLLFLTNIGIPPHFIIFLNLN